MNTFLHSFTTRNQSKEFKYTNQANEGHHTTNVTNQKRDVENSFILTTITCKLFST